MFKIIACINSKFAIGNEGKLIYRIPNDLQNFNKMTVGNVVIMGRKTFESLPNKEPLKNRINIIISSDKDYNVEQNDNVYVVNSIEDVIELCDAFFSDKDLFVIGGESIYREFIERNLVNEMRLTIVTNDFSDGDTHFPMYNENEWKTYYESLEQTSNEIKFIFKILKK